MKLTKQNTIVLPGSHQSGRKTENSETFLMVFLLKKYELLVILKKRGQKMTTFCYSSRYIILKGVMHSE